MIGDAFGTPYSQKGPILQYFLKDQIIFGFSFSLLNQI